MGKFIAGGLVVILLLLGLWYFLGGHGNGFGKGDGNNTKTVESNADVSSDEQEFVKVTVSENDYMYQNKTVELDELIKELKELDEDIVVEVTDEDASKNAYDNLISSLDENNIKYEIPENK